MIVALLILALVGAVALDPLASNEHSTLVSTQSAGSVATLEIEHNGARATVQITLSGDSSGEGSQGPAGPPGPMGPAGPQGPAGSGASNLDLHPRVAADTGRRLEVQVLSCGEGSADCDHRVVLSTREHWDGGMDFTRQTDGLRSGSLYVWLTRDSRFVTLTIPYATPSQLLESNGGTISSATPLPQWARPIQFTESFIVPGSATGCASDSDPVSRMQIAKLLIGPDGYLHVTYPGATAGCSSVLLGPCSVTWNVQIGAGW